MKKFYGTLILIITVIITNAQSPKLVQEEIDSLEKLLVTSQPGTHRVLILSDLALRNTRSNHEQALKYAQEGLALARKLKFRKGEADCLRRSGIVFSLQGRYPEALDRYQQALSISESIRDAFGIAAGLGHIGEIYAEQGDYRKARSYYYKFLEISEATHNESEQANALIKIGRTFLRQNNFDSAILFYNRAEKKVINNSAAYLLVNLWKDLGVLNAKKGNDDLAIRFFRKSALYASTGNDFITLNESYLGIADLYRKAGRSDSCIFYAQRALTAGQQNNYAKGILAASELLSKAYEPINEHEAFKYYKMAGAVKDSLFNTEKAAQVHNVFFVEQQRRQSLEAARIKYNNQLKLFALLTALGIFLSLAIILYRNNRNKQKANNLLQIQKKEIDQQRNKAERALEELKVTQAQLIQREKMASLGELTAGIAHEIQNPLNFINNFSEVSKELVEEIKQEAEKGNSEEIKVIADDVLANLNKVVHHGKRADAVVKNMLQHSRISTGEKQPTDINALADEYLRLTYHGIRAKDKAFNVSLQTDFDPSIGKVNAVPQDLGRVLINLFNNAFYAVNEKKKQSNGSFEPLVSVTTKKSNGKVEIAVRDNGTGIPQKVVDKIFQPFFTTKPTGEGTGLGLSLSYDIITKGHGGELTVNTKETEGTTFIIQLPL